MSYYRIVHSEMSCSCNAYVNALLCIDVASSYRVGYEFLGWYSFDSHTGNGNAEHIVLFPHSVL